VDVLADLRANGRSPLRSKSIGAMIAGFKSSFTTKMNRIDGTPKRKLWQRNYWEHIIRNENEYHRIAQYILDNPQKWVMDKLNNGMGNQVMESPAMYEAWMI
jgi:REP element-mobilizing transposase RayT